MSNKRRKVELGLSNVESLLGKKITYKLDSLCVLEIDRCNKCKFCKWLYKEEYASAAHDDCRIFTLLNIIQRCKIVNKNTVAKKITTADEGTLIRSGSIIYTPIVSIREELKYIPTPQDRLARFMRVLEHIKTYKGVDTYFEKLDHFHKLLMCTHLEFITGGSGDDRRNLLAMIDPYFDFSGIDHIVLVTARQNGKTHATAQFMAALILCCPLSGMFMNIYAQILEKACALMDIARRYLFWIQTPEGASRDIGKFKFIKNTFDKFSVLTDGEYSKIIQSRPKSISSCRGDHAITNFAEEAAFYNEQFIKTVILPLLSVSDRTVTMITTPPYMGTFFEQFLELWMEKNIHPTKRDRTFYVEDQSVRCGACRDGNLRCTHCFSNIPEWKTIRSVMSMNTWVVDSSDIDMEIYGYSNHNSKSCFHKKMIDNIICQPRPTDELSKKIKDPTVWLFIDPPAHGRKLNKSLYGMIAFIVVEGRYYVIGLDTASMGSDDIRALQKCIKLFCTRLQKHPYVTRHSKFIPIVEAVHSTIISAACVEAVKAAIPMENFFMPFTNTYFKKGIVDDVGVGTTNKTRSEGVEFTRITLCKNAFAFAKTVIHGQVETPEIAKRDIFRMWADQMRRFKFNDDGSINGKLGGYNDDLASSTVDAIYWHVRILTVLQPDKAKTLDFLSS